MSIPRPANVPPLHWDSWDRLSEFAVKTGRTLVKQLGWGNEGLVYSTTSNTAIKGYLHKNLYEKEKRVYERLSEKGVKSMRGFAVPIFVAASDEMCVLEMSIVMPPFIIDFANVYLDERPPFDPELDAERFVADPFSSTRGERMYKTGDLARYLPDGQIAFVGRVDDQIKIRGFRIEPEEISVLLNQFPGIQETVVVARGDGNDKYLVAYVVPAPEVELTDGALRAYARERLPEYMVPAIFVRLSALGITANGKIDRASLPAPSAENTIADEVRSQQPSTPVEEQVVAILSR